MGLWTAHLSLSVRSKVWQYTCCHYDKKLQASP